jgi:ribonuclease P protein component
MALPFKNRLKGKKDVGLILKEGKGKKGKFLIFKFLETKLKESRFAFIVSKKVSRKAVVRNKVKRRLSEIVRERIKELSKNIDGVFIALPGIEKESFQSIKKEIEKFFHQLKYD